MSERLPARLVDERGRELELMAGVRAERDGTYTAVIEIPKIWEQAEAMKAAELMLNAVRHNIEAAADYYSKH